MAENKHIIQFTAIKSTLKWSLKIKKNTTLALKLNTLFDFNLISQHALYHI